MKENRSSTAYRVSSSDISRKMKDQDKILLTLIMEAVKADRKQQAFDIVRLLQNSISMNAASQIAELYSSFALKERILLYKSEFEGQQRAKEKSERNTSNGRYLDDSHYDEPLSNGSKSKGMTSFEPRKGSSRRTAAATIKETADRYDSPMPVDETPTNYDFDSTLDSSVIATSPPRKRKLDDDFLSFEEPTTKQTSKRIYQQETPVDSALPVKPGKPCHTVLSRSKSLMFILVSQHRKTLLQGVNQVLLTRSPSRQPVKPTRQPRASRSSRGWMIFKQTAKPPSVSGIL
jgi:hypothetical protein